MCKRLSIIVLAFLLVSCRLKIDTNDTLLDKLVELGNASFVENPTSNSNKIVNDILSKRTNFYVVNYGPSRELDNADLLTHVQLMDTLSNPDIYFSISTYKSKKSALIAFRNSIDFNACCIPDEDIVKLKNFENIQVFKNGSSKLIYADNLVVTMSLGSQIDDNPEFNKLVDSYFEGTDFKKLEIGTGGPAIWTHP